MTRFLTLAIACPLSLIGSGITVAQDGYRPPCGRGDGCPGYSQEHSAYDAVPYSESYYPTSSGCQGGACSSAGRFDQGSAPSYRQPTNSYPMWQSPNVPDSIPTYNNPRTYTPTVPMAPRDSPPAVPSSRQFFNSPPPLPSQAERQPVIPQGMEGIAELSIGEQRVALEQRTCPVTKQPLGSMGKPIQVNVAGRSIFVCCQGCVDALQKNPAKYLSNTHLPTASVVR